MVDYGAKKVRTCFWIHSMLRNMLILMSVWCIVQLNCISCWSYTIAFVGSDWNDGCSISGCSTVALVGVQRDITGRGRIAFIQFHCHSIGGVTFIGLQRDISNISSSLYIGGRCVCDNVYSSYWYL